MNPIDVLPSPSVDGMPVAEFVFASPLDQSRPWSLALPADSQLVRSAQGGFVGGVIGYDQTPDATPRGSVIVGPRDLGFMPLPVLWPMVSMVVYSGQIVEVAVEAGGGALVAGPGAAVVSVNIGGTDYLAPVFAINPTSFQIDLSNPGPPSGVPVRFNAWWPAIRGGAGEWLGPAVFAMP